MSITVRRDGRVWSNKKRKYIKGSYSRKYLAVWTGYKREYIHRLVAMKYIPNPDNLPSVNHIDSNQDNNHVSNLEWCTHGENTKHAYDTGNNYVSEYQSKRIAETNIARSKYLPEIKMEYLKGNETAQLFLERKKIDYDAKKFASACAAYKYELKRKGLWNEN